jgi:hypothetical protein
MHFDLNKEVKAIQREARRFGNGNLRRDGLFTGNAY